MAKKIKPLVVISKADLAKLPRGEQRRYLDLGLVQGEPATTETPEGTKAKAK